jgi:pyruvate dehydrogenase E1 component alpha subunit
LISREKLLQLYGTMVKSRLIAERTGKLAQQGNLPPNWEIGVGGEATLAGVSADLRPDDTLSGPWHWMLGFLTDGIPLEDIPGPFAASLKGDGHSGSKRDGQISAPRNGRSAYAPDRTAIDFSSAVESAKVYKAAKDGRIVLAFYSNSSTSDVSGKQLELISRRSLPLVRVHYLSALDRRERSGSPEESRNGSVEALIFGVPRIAVDARDVLAVYRVASESISRARQGRGPTLIECVDWALPAGSRNADRNDSVADPVSALASYLGKKRILTATLKRQIESQLCREIDGTMKRLIN